MPQDTYGFGFAAALAGQIADSGAIDIDSAHVCSEDLSPGRVVELHTDGKLRAPQGTGAPIAKLFGVVVRKHNVEGTLTSSLDAADVGKYKAGEVVTVMRKGRVWAETVTPFAFTELDAAQVSHSSTIATHRGKVTSAASSGTAGAEIASTALVVRSLNSDSSLALLELNLP